MAPLIVTLLILRALQLLPIYYRRPSHFHHPLKTAHLLLRRCLILALTAIRYWRVVVMFQFGGQRVLW